MRQPMMLSAVCALLLLASGAGSASVAAQTPAATGSDDLVVLEISQQSGTNAVRFAIPASDRSWDWELKKGEYLAGAIAGPTGMVYAGITDGQSTAVYVIEAGSLTAPVMPKRIATVPGRSMVWNASADGKQILVLTFSGKPGEPLGMPKRVTSVAIPASVDVAHISRTGNGTSEDVKAIWYDLVQPAGQPASPTSRHLWRTTLQVGQKPVPQDTGVESSGYYSVLQAPDGQAVYLIDYFNQKIIVVDAAGGGAKRVITFGEHPFKRPPCGAAISADGDRLYVLSNLNNNTSSGYLIYDTHSWRQLAHFPNPQTTNPYCIGVSPDGQRLFVTSDQALVTLDAATGAEIDRMTFADATAPPDLVVTTSIRG